MSPSPHPNHWRFSAHASLRRRQMGRTKHEVRCVVRDPELTWTSRGQVVCQRDDLAVIVDPVDHTIVTVLPRTQELYVRPDAA